MRRFIFALTFCSLLLIALTFVLFPPAAAKENTLLVLLNLPAPAPPNSQVEIRNRYRDPSFYDTSKPPRDDAPIGDIIDYWTRIAGMYGGSSPAGRLRPSDRVVGRMVAEMSRKPSLVGELINILPDDRETAAAVKRIYDRAGEEDGIDPSQKSQLHDWLRLNSPYFADELEKTVGDIRDQNEYVNINDENNLLALTRHDFEKARPIVERMYAETNEPVSKVLATWALYRHALDTDSLGDIERYRSELMRLVEDRSQPDGVRDKANDALTHEKDFPGRDEWTLSLFEDETLVNMQRYTMLTTLVMYSPSDKYVPKMIELLEKSSNKTVRSAAVHNLALALSRGLPDDVERDTITALLPWLENPKWADDVLNARATLARKLAEHRIPESVPGLISMLDESDTVAGGGSSNSNTLVAIPSANTVAPAYNANANRATGGVAANTVHYPYRSEAIAALAKQKDGRAVPHLRRVLTAVEVYERHGVVKAILECNGFSISEQLDALEAAVTAGNDGSGDANTVSSAYSIYGNMKPGSVSAAELRAMLGAQIIQATEISDELARAVVDKIDAVQTRDPRLAAALRTAILKWQNAVINIVLLRDLKNGQAGPDTIVRLIAQRKDLRERHSVDVYDARTGKPEAVGITACILEDPNDQYAVLQGNEPDAKIALLACARLVRVPLAVDKVAENLASDNEMLRLAAERYLEAEDSPEARRIVLSRHPGEARIMGAQTAFHVENESDSGMLWMLYQSLGDNSLYYGWGGSGNDEELLATEKRLQDEVKKDTDMLGVYAYDKNYIRIYADRVIYSWDEDDARYRERPLNKEEFDEIKAYLTSTRADEQPPYITCGGGYCEAKELLMLGRNGGRRVYMNGDFVPEERYPFFVGLDKYFQRLRQTRGTLKYGLSREIPGLEIILADDALSAVTVWKDGADLRVAAADTAVRKRIEQQIEDVDPEGNVAEEEGITDEVRAKKAEEARKREFEGYGWYRVSDGSASPAAQPAGVEFIPLDDAYKVKPAQDQWKARATGVEVRASDEGLFKIVGGRMTRIATGSYSSPVISPNGRWVVVAKDMDEGKRIYRVNLTTNRETAIELEGYGDRLPIAYITSLNRVLVVRRYEYEGDYPEEAPSDDNVFRNDDDPEGMVLIDPVTGASQPIAGEYRPLSQQSFRPLQSAGRLNEYWAAMPDAEKNETAVGIYDTNHFGFRAVLKIPKMQFNSMGMFVDAPAGKIYFVYRGHLLSLPLPK